MHLVICHTKKRDAEVCEDSLHKAGAISTVCYGTRQRLSNRP